MRLICVLYGLSGLLSLAYQVAWFRVFVSEFGSTNLTFVLVLCSFIGGLGMGALLSAPLTQLLSRILRLRDPIRIYGVVEMMIAASVGLTMLATIIPADVWGTFPYRLAGNIFQPSRAFQISSIVMAGTCVFVPCVLMGITFPLLCYAFGKRSRFPSLLYGWNTLGACTGILLCEFLLLPRIGHDRTLWLAMGVNFLLGLFFFVRGGKEMALDVQDAAAVQEPSAAADTPTNSDSNSGGLHYSVLLVCAVLSGLMTGAIEGDVFKRLRFLGADDEVAMSFISFWAILAIFLGSWTVRALPRMSFGTLKRVAVAAVIVYALTWQLRDIIRGAGIFTALGDALLGLLVFTGIFVFPAFFLLSLLLPYVCNHVQADRRHLGIAYGANTVAFCAGMVAFTWIFPYVNIFYSLKLVMVLLAIFVAMLLLLRDSMPAPRWLPLAGIVACALAIAVTPARFEKAYFTPGSPPAVYPIRAMKSNAAHTTYIVEEPEGDVLYFTHHAMSATNPGALLYMRLMAHFPLLAQEEPKTALLICFGVGNTAAAIATHETIERIDVVDLNDKVLETAPEFAKTNHNVVDDPRLRMINDDGRNFLNRSNERYDLITSEPPPPMQEGIYRLYSEEYYASVNEHLTPTGMMTQWLPIYQMSPEAVDLAVSTFIGAFPHTLLFVGQTTNYILVGSNQPIPLHLLEQRFAASSRVREDLQSITVDRPLELIARIVQDDGKLRENYADMPTISDRRNDLAHVVLRASEPSLVTYDPIVVLKSIMPANLKCEAKLRSTLTNLARLKSVIRDFPESALNSVPASEAPNVKYAGVDWMRVRDLRFAAREAAGRKDFAKATELLREAMTIVPELSSTLLELGRAELRASDFDRAAETFARYLKLVPESAPGQFGRGFALLQLGQSRSALPYLTQAAALDPQQAVYHRALGDCLRIMGSYADAVRAYDQALAIDPSDQVARRNRDFALQRAP